MDPRPIGVFDSGMGGLTVLHECLVTMPHEDFVYLGDAARLPYGPRELPEVARFAHEIGAFLETQGVKLILVACNTATAAALPELQESLSVPVVGVIAPEAHAAVQATRNRRIGLLATAGTVACVARRPIRRLRVACTAACASGVITPTTGTSSSSCSCGSAAEVAALQATSTSFTSCAAR